jgi:hypothetical protein
VKDRSGENKWFLGVFIVGFWGHRERRDHRDHREKIKEIEPQIAQIHTD